MSKASRSISPSSNTIVSVLSQRIWIRLPEYKINNKQCLVRMHASAGVWLELVLTPDGIGREPLGYPGASSSFTQLLKHSQLDLLVSKSHPGLFPCRRGWRSVWTIHASSNSGVWGCGPDVQHEQLQWARGKGESSTHQPGASGWRQASKSRTRGLPKGLLIYKTAIPAWYLGLLRFYIEVFSSY